MFKRFSLSRLEEIQTYNMMGYEGGMDGCGQFIKYSLFVSNLIIFIVGLVMVGLGIWTVQEKGFVNELLGTNLFMGAVYTIIGTGGIVTIIAFFGCLGAIKEVKCMLLSYAMFLLIILVVMLLGGILCFVFVDKVHRSIENEMYSSIKFYEDKKVVRRAWDDIQEYLQCCGVESYIDWKGNVPESCCKTLSGKRLNCKSFQTSLNIHTKGCLNATENYIGEHAKIIGGAAIIASSLMMLGLIFSMVMFKLIT